MSSPLSSTPPVPPAARMRTAPLILVLLGALLITIAGGIGIGGATVAALAGLQRDGDFLTSSTERFSFDSYALTSSQVEVNEVDGVEDLPAGLATLRLRATAADPGQAVFIGVARQDDVDAYLSSVHHTELRDLRTTPFRAVYRDVPGSGVPGPPAEQEFWTMSASGTGMQEITADLRAGNWAVVIMNADGSPAGAEDLQAGFRSTLFAPIGVALLLTAVLLLLVGIPLVLAGASGLGRGLDPSLSATRQGRLVSSAERHHLDSADAARDLLPHPASLSGSLRPGLSRWLWLVKWFLALPHAVILVLLWVACWVCTIAAGIVILFTGRYPATLFPFTVGVLRWTWRVQFYSSVLGTDKYPPFTLAPVDAYPADFHVPYPARLHRGLVLVKGWLLALPHLLILAVLTGAWSWTATGTDPGQFARTAGPSLLGILALVAGVALLFTARYPRPLFDFVMGISRWTYRVLAYVLLLRDEYPPFRLDQGPDEPDPQPQDPHTPGLVEAGRPSPAGLDR
ncbi:DUF4389 domain-containing protein [Arthrobacter agilis]|uniref:DUF4389 domain-containing protein n=1 Tax=Arthrobacter agilis TaxID=37921 RepID=UPI00278A5D01|nr:DUF4389 domain-containing protein [Arthrobacter agilis]MDQ0734879.1 hypothetical protein [Arthrobacter agilis]